MSNPTPPSALAVLSDVASYLQAGLGSDDVLAGVVGAVCHDLALPACCIWVRDRAGAGFRPIVPVGHDEPPPEAVLAVGEWPVTDGPSDSTFRCPLHSEGRTIGWLEATVADRPRAEDDRRVLGLVANILAPWLASLELAEDLASEVAFRTRESEAQRRFTARIIDSLPVGLYVVDREYRIQAWNQTREIGSDGIARDEAIGREVFEVLTRQPAELMREEFDRVFATGTMEQMEIGSTASGDLRHYRISKIPMRLDDDEITHVITIAEDITEWRAIQQQIAQTEKLAAVGQLAAGVMHELNNPLATIGACAEALQMRLESLSDAARQPYEEYLGIIDSELTRCQDIVTGLLDFSNPKAHTKAPADVNQLVGEALFLVKHHDRFRRITLVHDPAPALPRVEANDKQLIQVFLALMLNAIDAMDEDGTLTVRTGQNPDRGDEVVVEFRDTGAGIARDDLPKIFEPFFTTKSPGRGTGLGLSICYAIVQEHRGRMVADSQPGQGATFRVFLPLARPDGGTEAA